MNWLIQEKMFTYFYNKFRPVNCTYCIKCDVNSPLLTQFWLLHKVCGTLVHYLIKTHSIHSVGWFKNLIWCDVLWNKAPHTGPSNTWRIYILCPFSGHKMNTDGSADGWMLSLANAGYGSSWVTHLLSPHLVFPPIWGWSNLGSFQFLQSNSLPEGAWNLSGYI